MRDDFTGDIKLTNIVNMSIHSGIYTLCLFV